MTTMTTWTMTNATKTNATMTEPTDPETEAAARAERIARLQARQLARSTGSPAGVSGAGVSASARRRRRSPAASSKVLVAGASSAAVLSLMAGFGIGDRIGATDEALPLVAGDQALIPATSAASIEPAPSSPAPLDVIVVVVDESGRVIATSADLDPAEISIPAVTEVANDAPVTGTDSAGVLDTTPVQSAPAVAEAPATAPTRVEVPVAIPAPASAAPAAAAAAAPAQATTGGS
jgi:hypothetical protein